MERRITTDRTSRTLSGRFEILGTLSDRSWAFGLWALRKQFNDLLKSFSIYHLTFLSYQFLSEAIAN